MTNTEAMAALAKNALAFAQCYVALVEALQSQGVPEDVARQEARATAAMMSMMPEDSGEECPMCGGLP